MAKYIELDETIRAISGHAELIFDTFDLMKIIGMLEEMPAADVAPVVHGWWVGKPIAGFCNVRCSACGCLRLASAGNEKYCPNCGARMDVENT